MKKIKCVIFDLDGTVGDTVPLCIKAFKKSIEPLINKSVSDEEIIATFGPSEEGTIMALAPNSYDKGVEDYLKYYDEYHEMCPKPFDGIVEILKFLKDNGVKIAMVTGKGKYSTEITLKKFSIDEYFEIIETGVVSGPSKPQGIERVLKHFNEFEKDEFIYVGDAPSDITASRKVGIPVVSVAWAQLVDLEKLKELKPNEIFQDVNKFYEWIREKI